MKQLPLSETTIQGISNCMKAGQRNLMVAMDDGDVRSWKCFNPFWDKHRSIQKIMSLKWSSVIKINSCPGSCWAVPWTEWG